MAKWDNVVKSVALWILKLAKVGFECLEALHISIWMRRGGWLCQLNTATVCRLNLVARSL